MVNNDLNSLIYKIRRRLLFSFAHLLPDRFYLQHLFPLVMGYPLDLENPCTFNEKLQWLKLYNRRPEYTQMVDKYEVKKFVSDLIGEEYVIPILSVYDSVDDIDFDRLPDQFVLKCTHNSGGVVICKDKKAFDKDIAIKKLKNALKRNFFWRDREWPYKNVKPRIIAEKYMEDKEDAELRDYKFYCFNGKPMRLLLATGRQDIIKGLCFDYFDMNFNHLGLTNHWHPNASPVPHRPNHFEEMKLLAAKLSYNIPHVRVDFYEANDKVYFGEMTFFDMGGHLAIHPDEWDLEWGGFLDLPVKG